LTRPTNSATIELARRLQPDLILLDIYLPDISG
jgi:response regulator of citrate/malate metabolism